MASQYLAQASFVYGTNQVLKTTGSGTLVGVRDRVISDGWRALGVVDQTEMRRDRRSRQLAVKIVESRVIVFVGVQSNTARSAASCDSSTGRRRAQVIGNGNSTRAVLPRHVADQVLVIAVLGESLQQLDVGRERDTRRGSSLGSDLVGIVARLLVGRVVVFFRRRVDAHGLLQRRHRERVCAQAHLLVVLERRARAGKQTAALGRAVERLGTQGHGGCKDRTTKLDYSGREAKARDEKKAFRARMRRKKGLLCACDNQAHDLKSTNQGVRKIVRAEGRKFCCLRPAEQKG